MINKFIILSLIAIFVGSFVFVPLSEVLAVEPLVVSNVTIVVSDMSTQISWQTNRNASGRVDYGILNGNYPFRVDTNVSTTNQSIILNGLFPNTTYYFVITATDQYSQISSYQQSFKTKEYSDSKVPIINHVSVVYTTGTTATIQWYTDEPASTEVDFGMTEKYTGHAGVGGLTTIHDITIKGLAPATTYQFKVSSKDKDNNVALWYNMSFRTNDTDLSDKDALIIYDIKPTGQNDQTVLSNSAVVSWRTNKLAEGKVFYGTNPASLNQSISIVPPRDFTNSATLNELTPGTVYYFRIEAKDVFGVLVKSEGHSFKTAGANNNADVINLPVQNYVPAPTYDGQVLGAATGGLIVYLPFDEGSGTYVKDMSFNGNDGQLSLNNPPSWTTGQYGNALLFAGNGQNVRVADDDQISLRKQVSMVAWINARSFGKYDKFISKEDSYEILMGPDDGVLRMALYPQNGGDWVWLNTPNRPITLNQWILIAGTYDGQTMRLYANGQLVGEKQTSMTINDTSFPMYLGGNVVDNREWFDGAIDEVGVFDYSLTQQEIQTIYQYGLSHYLVSVGIPTQNNPTVTPPINQNGIVLGSAYAESNTYACNPDLGYTKIKALYKTSDSPDIWAILETGYRHYITSPESFNQYQCNWNLIKNVSRSTLEKYPVNNLVRTPDNPTVYRLFQRAETKWLKINIPSPTVFISYSDNYWGNIARVTQLDINSYPDVKLIKTANNPNVYLIDGAQKQLIPSEAVFNAHQFEWFEVAVLNQIHLESYQDGPALQ